MTETFAGAAPSRRTPCASLLESATTASAVPAIAAASPSSSPWNVTTVGRRVSLRATIAASAEGSVCAWTTSGDQPSRHDASSHWPKRSPSPAATAIVVTPSAPTLTWGCEGFACRV